jgi:hypothetical protein
MSAAPTAPLNQRLIDAQTRMRVLNLAVAGWSETQIGVALNLSCKRVYKILEAEIKRCDRLAIRGADELRRLELLRLDEMLKSLWPIISGQVPSTRGGPARAVEVALKVCESRRKLLGLDAPEKRELTVDATVEQLSAAELAAEGQRLGLPPVDVTLLAAYPLPGENRPPARLPAAES